ncbi:thiamine pyrophosphate-binding protein [Actinobacteria bacterium YIM 96077]|uniref:Thiamine pyrophosphate-binding protein n=1 Tax=Phytoactinopolyspora halophila TaxID=1981511 RepID=A0A329QTV7_9ACTN|nr:thiamine pyrophosphate-binding protein [Phytoactinopolyspora halophila]AYY14999.1 thiamine pyrophosphate-binding protein [Actinobacteria bacterium YIM 96077]RAW15456.1 thiamine pyrophosphate-binding protein [Phytoactinopolyspora halophila]
MTRPAEATTGPESGAVRSAETSVAQLVGETLWELGVRQVFGVVGSGNFMPTAALAGAGARYTAARHEGAAITMADGYTRVSGELAVCSVHQGPGLTNTITGLVDAAKSRTPILVLAGQTSAGATRSNFSVDQVGLVERAGAISEQLYRPESAVEDTVRAYRRACSERRPVVLQMPLDIQAAQVKRGDAASVRVRPALSPDGDDGGALETGAGLVRRTCPSRDVVSQLAKRLSVAERPLLIAGRGAVVSGARDSLTRLGERAGALLANTAVASGFFRDDPWTLGIVGGFASDEAAELMGQADLVVGFGCSFTSWTTRHGRLFAPDATVIQVDSDANALGLNPRVDIGVVGDVHETADAILADLAEYRGDAGWRSEEAAARIHDHHTAVPSGVAGLAGGRSTSPEWVHPQELSLELEALMPAERTVVVDGGHFLGWPVTCWSVPDPAGFVFTSSGFQSIGLGLAGAIGAHLARPDRLTVLAAGDGGFLMSLSELETLVRLGLPLLVIVYDDAAYGAEVHHFSPHVGGGGGVTVPGESGGSGDAGGLDLVRFPATDIAAVARGAGAAGVTVRDVADLGPVASWLDGPAGPMVVDAKIDPGVVGYWAEQDFRGH